MKDVCAGTSNSDQLHNMTSVRTMRSGMWAISGKLLSRLIDIVTMMVLARALTPADFGLVAISMSIILIAEALLELPVNAVLIINKDCSDEVLGTAFTLGLVRAFLVAALSCLAGLILAYTHDDKQLFWLTAVLSLAPAMRGLISPLVILRAQSFDFRPLFFMEVSGKAIAFILATLVAVSASTYWAIALGTVAAPTVMAIMSYYISPYRPRLTLRSWRVFSNFIGWTALTQLLSAVSWQMERLILPRWIAVPDFGRFVTASDIASLPGKAVIQPLIMPLLAGFSTIKENSDTRLAEAYLKASESLSTAILPVLVVIIVFSLDLTNFLLGAQWHEAAPIISWLCAISILSVPRSFVAPLLFTLGNVGAVTCLVLVELALKLPLLFLLIPSMGISGALIAHAAGSVSILIASVLALEKFTKVPVWRQVIGFLRPGSAALSMYFVMTIIQHMGISWRSIDLSFLIAVPVGFVVYAVLIGALWVIAGRPAGAVATAFGFYSKLRGSI